LNYYSHNTIVQMILDARIEASTCILLLQALELKTQGQWSITPKIIRRLFWYYGCYHYLKDVIFPMEISDDTLRRGFLLLLTEPRGPDIRQLKRLTKGFQWRAKRTFQRLCNTRTTSSMEIGLRNRYQQSHVLGLGDDDWWLTFEQLLS